MSKQKKKPRILLFDVENSPSTAYIWALYQDVLSTEMIKEPWYMLCWGAKWLGEKKIYSKSLIDFPKHFKEKPECDKLILGELWKLLDEADIVIAHNGDKFDIRKVNARFIMNGMKPPSIYKSIDTLKSARKYFFFTSNRLTDLGKYLGVGEKVETGGFKLWRDCMMGKKTAWKKMVRYCKRDITLLEDIYLKLRPYISNHPNVGVYVDDDEACPKCGSGSLRKEGFCYTNRCKYQQYSCKGCGGWSRGYKNLRGIE